MYTIQVTGSAARTISMASIVDQTWGRVDYSISRAAALTTELWLTLVGVLVLRPCDNRRISNSALWLAHSRSLLSEWGTVIVLGPTRVLGVLVLRPCDNRQISNSALWLAHSRSPLSEWGTVIVLGPTRVLRVLSAFCTTRQHSFVCNPRIYVA